MLQASSSLGGSGRRLCLALLMAGRPISSGFERESGCPGGAIGFRILSKIGLDCLDLPLFGELFLTILAHLPDDVRGGPMLAPTPKSVNVCASEDTTRRVGESFPTQFVLVTRLRCRAASWRGV